MARNRELTVSTPRYLACFGDVNDPGYRGGSPFNLTRAGKAVGFLTDGWSVFPDRLRLRRLLWNLRELVWERSVGGYQYSRACASDLLSQVPDSLRHGEVISTFPLFPIENTLRGTLSFYIDATLIQLFEDYGIGRAVSKRIRHEALQRERDQYQIAKHVCCMSRWAAAAVVGYYGVTPDRVHVIGGGANVAADGDLAGLKRDEPRNVRPIRLGFMGKDWDRKGLPFLLEVAETLQAMGCATVVSAGGFAAESGPKHPQLEAVGFIDKQKDPQRFSAFIRSCHVGCLFSDAEAYGLSNLEFLRLGVPVVTWSVGGMADTVPEGCGNVFSKGETAIVVASWIRAHVVDEAAYSALLANVDRNAEHVTWDRVVARMREVWDGSLEYSYR